MKPGFPAFTSVLLALGLVSAPVLSAQQPASQTGVVDVTAPVSAQVKDGRLAVTVNTALAGGQDPARKVPKRLVVIYVVDGRENVATAREGSQVEIAAPVDKALTIEKALYGNLPDHPDMRLLLATSFPAASLVPSSNAPPAQGEADEENEAGTPTIFLPRPALQVSPIKPVHFEKRGNNYFADFGADAYGNLQITFPAPPPAGTLTIGLGEKLAGDAIDRQPPGSVNYVQVPLALESGKTVYQTEIPIPKRGYQSHDTAIRTPPEIGNVAPFRYAEIEGSPAALADSAVRLLSVHTAFDDNAATFHSADETLNAVWALCKHTMQATTAFGVYVDGNRERRPYEGDAYINFLSHLACDANPEVGRYSIEYLLAHPTWPTEWKFHLPMMAAADYEATGDPALAARNYEALKRKLLMNKARPDGLLNVKGIIDWPPAERDGCDAGLRISTVVNAFYYHTLQKMAELARAVGKNEDAALFETKAKQVREAVNARLFDAATGLYLDGEGATHSSILANAMPLAFGLVPPERVEKVAAFVQGRGMACSVYGAQYLLEALYNAGRPDAALKLLTSREQRSWWNMLKVGSTMTMEAWDFQFKGNSTWNHAWGAAPGNIIARYLLGVRPLTPGYGKILIAPRPGPLAWAEAKVPTPRGPVLISFKNGPAFTMEATVPEGTTARVSLPYKPGQATRPTRVFMDKKPAAATTSPDCLDIDNVPPGHHSFESK